MATAIFMGLTRIALAQGYEETGMFIFNVAVFTIFCIIYDINMLRK